MSAYLAASLTKKLNARFCCNIGFHYINVTVLYSLQLFEKLKVQESTEEAAHEKASEPCAPAGDGEPDRTELELSEGGKTKRTGKETSEKKEARRYGKIHTRHISQLFIRGESVLLVNPQPLWY